MIDRLELTKNVQFYDLKIPLDNEERQITNNETLSNFPFPSTLPRISPYWQNTANSSPKS
ncbi:hypothetical protein FE839_24275 [Klebsiella indica]|uniref:Uncharacterized protein n=1 Tax=Klebsiella indica TaxID=2582917 RepID=A0A5R9L135_9ENTR|nr:hypothetical protein FE839_24275 [Klebsiella indica]